jgi:pimeloyl-ACP methyl ester carboxylesterase
VVLSRILIVVGVELAILAGLAVWLVEVEANGPRRIEARLADGRAAILYLPHPAQNSTAIANAQASKRLPVAILVSGLGAGPLTMASLGRRLAHNGYASLAIGIPMAHFASAGNEVYKDIAAAVDYARVSKLVDGSRVVLIGHSAGAGAVTVYATRDRAIGGVILISGGCYLNAGDRLRDALFVFTSRDPEEFRNSCREVVKRLSGIDHPRLTEVYGDFHSGTAISEVEIHGESHVSIVGSKRTASHAVGWLDRIFETKRTDPPDLSDPQGFVTDLVLASILIILLPLYYSWLRRGRVARGTKTA